MLTCKICGHEFSPVKDEHYISRDKEVIGGLVAAISNSEPATYDTFDCPVCGCQVIAQERKRKEPRDFDMSELLISPGVPAPPEVEDDLK